MRHLMSDPGPTADSQSMHPPAEDEFSAKPETQVPRRPAPRRRSSGLRAKRGVKLGEIRHGVPIISVGHPVTAEDVASLEDD